MKRAIIAVLMIAFITAFSAVSNNIIKKRVTSLLENTVAVSENVETFSNQEIKEELSDLIAEWKRTEKLLLLFDSHDKFEKISELFGLLETEKNANANEAEKLRKETENAIHIYLKSRDITVQNILRLQNDYNNVQNVNL